MDREKYKALLSDLAEVCEASRQRQAKRKGTACCKPKPLVFV